MDNRVDPVDSTGCREQSDVLILCHDKYKDWRECKQEMEAFKKCYSEYLQSAHLNGDGGLINSTLSGANNSRHHASHP